MPNTPTPPPQIDTGLSKILKEWRNKRGFRANVMAQELGIPARTYENIEQGRVFRYPKLIALALLALSKKYPIVKD